MTELRGWQRLAHRAFIIMIALTVLTPLYWLVLTSITPQVYIAGTPTPTMVPKEPTPKAYEKLVRTPSDRT